MTSSRAPTLIAFDHRFQDISYLASGVEIGDYSRVRKLLVFCHGKRTVEISGDAGGI